LHTALIFAKNLGVPASKVAIDDDLYHSSAHQILEVVKKTSDICDAAMYFVHNPGITDFVNEMTNASVRNVPTTGVICVRFDCEHWSDVGAGAELIQFEYPKRIKE
jgi:phosphohistidine phosphatase